MEGSQFIGVDMGGTHLRAALVDEDGEIRRRTKTATRSDAGPEAVLERLTAACRELMRHAEGERRRVRAVGLGVAGRSTEPPGA